MAKLYVVTDCGVYWLPLDIGKLRNRDKIPPKLYVPPHVEFEKLEWDSSPDGEIPYYMHPIVVDGHLLLAGGWVPPSFILPNIDLAYEIADDRLKPIPSPPP